MNDDEFLSYCQSNSSTPRCGFVPEHLARLCSLAGHEINAACWQEIPNQVINADRYQVRELVAEARARLST